MKTLVIVPTYNEKENIEKLVPELFKLYPQISILIVDDRSPDKTYQRVLEMRAEFPQLNLLLREKKEGLGKAYLAGFQWGLSNGFEVLIEMDADFSHRPVDLGLILAGFPNHSVVIGSRYVPGGKTVNWGFIRKLISRGGSLYSRWVLGFPTRDWTGGFNAWKVEVLKAIDLSTVHSNGYSFQIELKYKAQKKGFQIQEVPIVFEDRRVGKSKMSFKIVVEAFYRVWLIRWNTF